MSTQLAEHWFRHESARLVASLCRRFGTTHLELVEDAVQSALLEAMQAWRTGVPDQPAAWLYRVAANRVLDQLRHAETGTRIARRLHDELTVHGTSTSPAGGQDSTDALAASIDARGLDDDVLRLCFVVCHPGIAMRERVMMALKHLCGFGVDEIARGLLMNPEAVKKQLQRTARQLRDLQIDLELPVEAALTKRLDSVHQVFYMVFNEGYSCARGERVIREDVCAEAARLCHLLCEHPLGNGETRALLALMMLHAARLPARVDSAGDTVLLEHQDRSLWDREVIHEATRWLQASAMPDGPGRYHLEATIAWLHSVTDTFDATPWDRIIDCYDALIRRHDSPVYRLNRAIAIACRDGLDAARAELERLEALPGRASRLGLLCTRAWIEERDGAIDAAITTCDRILGEDLAPHEWRLISAQRERLYDKRFAVTATR